MATVVETVVRDGETINIYESGAQYNVTRKHLVAPAEKFTTESSRKAKERLAELKREAVARGAARALEKAKPEDWDTPNKLDVAEAIGEAIMLKALNPENPKQVDAARFILQESGMAESQPKTSESAQQFSDIADAFLKIVEFMRGDPQSAQVINGTATDIRSENGG